VLKLLPASLRQRRFCSITLMASFVLPVSFFLCRCFASLPHSSHFRVSRVYVYACLHVCYVSTESVQFAPLAWQRPSRNSVNPQWTCNPACSTFISVNITWPSYSDHVTNLLHQKAISRPNFRYFASLCVFRWDVTAVWWTSFALSLQQSDVDVDWSDAVELKFSQLMLYADTSAADLTSLVCHRWCCWHIAERVLITFICILGIVYLGTFSFFWNVWIVGGVRPPLCGIQWNRANAAVIYGDVAKQFPLVGGSCGMLRDDRRCHQ